MDDCDKKFKIIGNYYYYHRDEYDLAIEYY